jgi:hypothetical protein
VLYDLPRVVEGATDLLAKNGVERRCEVMGGDFFKTVPEGCDAYGSGVVGGAGSLLVGASAIDFVATFMVSSSLLSWPRRSRHK